jgi:hypothetical protein
MFKIGDFGISRMLKSNSEDAVTFIGTPVRYHYGKLLFFKEATLFFFV